MIQSQLVKPEDQTSKTQPFWAQLQELQKCEFAGEVVIRESELPELGEIVGRELLRAVQTTASLGRLVLLAVNCAYYRADDEGFWSAFLALLGLEDNQSNAAWIRPKLEDALIKLGFQDGPYLERFRYVTPVRMQAGLTRHDFPAFARLLNLGRERYGWSRMRTMPHPEFVNFVQGTMPGTKFRDFLEDEQGGGALTRSVLDDLVRWKQGISTGDYPSAHGYRPGFWEDLLPQVETNQPSRPTIPRSVPVPKFVFEPARSQLGLLFAQDLVNRRAVRIEGEVICDSFLPISNVADLRDRYRSNSRLAATNGSPHRLSDGFRHRTRRTRCLLSMENMSRTVHPSRRMRTFYSRSAMLNRQAR